MDPGAPSTDTRPPLGERALVLLLRLLRVLLAALTWPWRAIRRRQERPLRIVPYRGYGTSNHVTVRGRVVDTPPPPPAGASKLDRLRTLFRRLSTPPVPKAEIEGRLDGRTVTTESDTDGLFTLRFVHAGIAPEGQWEEIELLARAEHPSRAAGKGEARAAGHALIPKKDARYAIVSDIDDTVVYTGVANKLKMMWTLFATEADARAAFDGVGELYRALHRGPDDAGPNPIFYVSRGPWGIYPVMEEFFQQRGIPVGPVLLLRDWGVSLAHPWPKRAPDHKRELIDELLETYPDMPFVFLGDSGQHDPEIYADAVERWGPRIECCYIRDVSADPERTEEIERLAARCAEKGSEMVLAADSAAIAEHAARRGFIADGAVPAVREDTAREQARA